MCHKLPPVVWWVLGFFSFIQVGSKVIAPSTDVLKSVQSALKHKGNWKGNGVVQSQQYRTEQTFAHSVLWKGGEEGNYLLKLFLHLHVVSLQQLSSVSLVISPNGRRHVGIAREDQLTSTFSPEFLPLATASLLTFQQRGKHRKFSLYTSQKVFFWNTDDSL